MNNWREVFHEQLEGFQKAALTPLAFVLGTREDQAYVSRHLPVIGWQANMGWYETPTLDELYRWSIENPGGAVLYCHSKGVSQPNNPNRTCWRKLMMKHLAEPWKENLGKLEFSDAVGVNFSRHRGHHYFEGNFWMARADWIMHLPPPWEHRQEPRTGWMRPERIHAEMWLLSRPYHKAASILCQGRWLGDTPTCEELSTAAPAKPFDLREAVHVLRKPGALENVPPELQTLFRRLVTGCHCNHGQIPPLIEQMRPYLPAAIQAEL